MTETLSEGHRNRNRLTLAESFHWIHFRKRLLLTTSANREQFMQFCVSSLASPLPEFENFSDWLWIPSKMPKLSALFATNIARGTTNPDSRNRVILDLSNLATWTICHISWDCYLLELLSSSARVTSIKSQQGLRLRSGRMYGSPWTRSVLWHFASLPPETQPPVLSLQNIICTMKINSPNRLYSGRIG